MVKNEVMKFDGTGNFGLWQRRVKDLLVHRGLVNVLEEKAKKPEKMLADDWEVIQMKDVSSPLSSGWCSILHHGWKISFNYVEETGESIYVEFSI